MSKKTYDKAMYHTFKALALPSLASSYFFGNELVQNVSNYNAEQFIVAGGAAVICGGAGLLGLFSKKKHFGLEDRIEEAKNVE